MARDGSSRTAQPSALRAPDPRPTTGQRHRRGPADRAGGLRRRLESVIGTPFTEGNEVTVLRNGDEIFPAMLEAIRGAESTVDL